MKKKMSQSQLRLQLLLTLAFFFHGVHSSATVVVDGTSVWENPTVHVGDVVVFKHKHDYALYIFQNQRAFNLCNFTQASLLTKLPSSSYTWHPSRLGFFYFGFSNGSVESCQQPAQKVGVEVLSSLPPPDTIVVSPESPPQAAAPAPASGGVITSSPAFPWPFSPHEELSPTPAPANSPAAMPSIVPDKAGAIPFINSNPAVPLPTGEVDSATIQPQPTSGHKLQAAAGPLQLRVALLCMAMVIML